MAKVFFSKTTLGFYRDDIHSTMPEDVVEIGEELHIALLEALSCGGVRLVGDADGAPALEPLPPSTRRMQLDQIRERVRVVLDSKAREAGFFNIQDAVSYADEPVVPVYQYRGKALRRWRSLMWLHVETHLVAADTDDLLGLLPQLLETAPRLEDAAESN